MMFQDNIGSMFSFGVKQLKVLVDIFLLKLRIIGFANKRNGLFAKLGEVSYKLIKSGGLEIENDQVRSFIKEIEEADREILSAESEINKVKSAAQTHRAEYREMRKKTAPEEPAAPEKPQPAIPGEILGSKHENHETATNQTRKTETS